MNISRREFSLRSGAVMLSVIIGGTTVKITPGEAKEKNLPFQSLNKEQTDIIDLLGEAIVPGARGAGLSHYIDHQLSMDLENNFLILRYLGVAAPFKSFYASALSAFHRAIKKKYNKGPKDLNEAEMTEFINIMMQKNPDGWGQNASPAPFFYFVLRSDAIDVTYGSIAGFENLDIPYMAHIAPKHNWKVAP